MRKSSASLVVIYNHAYPKNIKKIERFYKDSFSQVIHMVPFHLEDSKNVLPVFQSSYLFGGHIAASWSRIKEVDSDYFVFLGDDLLLNPRINEGNLQEEFNLDESKAYIDSYFSLGELNTFWKRAVEAISWEPLTRGVELPVSFPSASTMSSRLSSMGSTSMEISRKAIYKTWDSLPGSGIRSIFRKIVLSTLWNIKHIPRRSRTLRYPLIGGYSDIVIIPRKYTLDFCRLCGIFSTLGLHAELSIPTVLKFLFTNSISTAENSNISRAIVWDKQKGFLSEVSDKSVEGLRRHFPLDISYAHPIKLSEWE